MASGSNLANIFALQLILKDFFFARADALARDHGSLTDCVGTLLLVLSLLAVIVVHAASVEPIVAIALIHTAKTVVLIYLLELRAETFLGLLRRELQLELLNGFSDLGFVACVITQRDTEQLTHVSQHLDVEMVVFELAAGGTHV